MTNANHASHKVHPPVAVANYLLGKSKEQGKEMTILQIVKLVYLAHGWCWGFFDRPLIREGRVQAWKYGPVIPEVYWMFRPQGVVICDFARDRHGKPYQADMDEEQTRITDDVYRIYHPLSPIRLTAITHTKGTPWAQTPGHYATIPEDTIRNYYRDLVRKAEND